MARRILPLVLCLLYLCACAAPAPGEALLQVQAGISWVSVQALGQGQLTAADTAALLCAAPRQKQQAVTTLADALQLFTQSGFTDGRDNAHITMPDGRRWEVHKGGYDALRTNHGCCATAAAWLSYVLQDDYDSLGYLFFSWGDGSGHVINCIEQDGAYYAIDMTCRISPAQAVPDETRPTRTALRRAWQGAVYRFDDLETFAAYYAQKSGCALVLHMAPGDITPVAVEQTPAGGVCVMHDARSAERITLLYDDPRQSLTYDFATAPLGTHAFADVPDFDFTALKGNP